MKIDKFEIWVHDTLLKNEKLRHGAYIIYQKILRFFSKKVICEGNISLLVPDDEFEYLFGYYDKCPWNSIGDSILALRVKNTKLSPDSMDEGSIVICKDGEVSVEVATTRTWNVQQGCMLQWIDDKNILFNDFRDDKYCSVIVNLDTYEEKIIQMPVYSVASNKQFALSLDFSRLHRLRPGYGYANIPDKYSNIDCPDDYCIWYIDLVSGDYKGVLKYTDLNNFEHRTEMDGAVHKVNHIMLNPGCNRFMFLHRWFKNGKKYSRLVTCDIDGRNMYNLSDDDFVSHCCWKNDEYILSYLNKPSEGKRYYLLKDQSKENSSLWPELSMDGHPTYSYSGSLVVTDTYADRKRLQSIYVMDGDIVRRIARVYLPFDYNYDSRCDLHPRWSLDNRKICFDSAYSGIRKIYSVDI